VIEKRFSRFELQVREKDGTRHRTTSLPNILREWFLCVNDQWGGRQELSHSAVATPGIGLKKLKTLKGLTFDWEKR
jgi:hypothetical protein